MEDLDEMLDQILDGLSIEEQVVVLLMFIQEIEEDNMLTQEAKQDETAQLQ